MINPQGFLRTAGIGALAAIAVALSGNGCSDSQGVLRSKPSKQLTQIVLEEPVSSSVKDKDNHRDYDEMSYTEVMREIRTPEQAQDYIDRFVKPADTIQRNYPFEMVHNSIKGGNEDVFDCKNGGAYPAAAMLRDNGYKPTALLMCPNPVKERKGGHVVFLYEQNGKFGTVGLKRGMDYRPAVFDSPEAIMEDYNKKGIKFEGKPFRYLSVIDMNKLTHDWVNGSKPF